MIREHWFIMYGGTSCDGRGSAKYAGRTLDPNDAAKFLKENDSPYSFAYVQVIDDHSSCQMNNYESFKGRFCDQ